MTVTETQTQTQTQTQTVSETQTHSGVHSGDLRGLALPACLASTPSHDTATTTAHASVMHAYTQQSLTNDPLLQIQPSVTSSKPLCWLEPSGS